MALQKQMLQKLRSLRTMQCKSRKKLLFIMLGAQYRPIQT